MANGLVMSNHQLVLKILVVVIDFIFYLYNWSTTPDKKKKYVSLMISFFVTHIQHENGLKIVYFDRNFFNRIYGKESGIRYNLT